MTNLRPLRVASLIREELAKLIVKELEFPGALPTITEVEIAHKDMEWAVVKVSVVPSEKAQEALAILEKNKFALQNLLNKKLNIRPMPKIKFEIDHGLENAAEVEKILIKEQDNN